ncbi:AMP-binding enzyme [Microbacterium jepli]|uniref:AMP-binding enzyme n=1 Tax=Microbacterium sp. 1P10UE TaxID=3132288 RepID=UPI0039A3CB8C
MRYGLDFTPNDVYLNAADPGWAYGLYYGIVGPLALGRANILLSGSFSPGRMGRAIDELAVTNLAASPTMYRALKKEGLRSRRPLRAASSCGEPLTSDVIAWSPDELGVTVRDHWGQTEQGMAIVNCWEPRLRRPIQRGSMGQAMPGFTAGIIDRTIALSVSESPLMWFTGYQDAVQQTEERFSDDGSWYLTGDVGHSDGADLFFSSREDDVILAAGYRIAPFDIEAILSADPVVVECAVVGRPDDLRGEAIEAFVVLTTAETSGVLVQRLQDAVRVGYGAHAYPRRVHMVTSLPKTPSGKVQRNLLRSLTDDELIQPTN